jgi:hypothetical protein
LTGQKSTWAVSMRIRWLVAATALALVAAACGSDGPPGTAAGPVTTDPEGAADTTGVPETTEAATTTRAATTGLPEGPSALDGMGHPDFPEPLVDTGRIFPGGPPPDGIPPIDDPQFVGVDAADVYLTDAEPVVVLEIDGDARAYPAQILIWHEIVNDVVGGVPVAITYCPLCNSAVTYGRTVRGEVTTFGTSGMLFNSALVMYDRATESLWTHFDGRAVVGLLTGELLEPLGSPLLAWGDFKASYPDGRVLDRDNTGHSRDYGRNPYAGYDNPDGVPFLFRGDADDRARELQRVVGVTVGEESAAFTLEAIASEAGVAVTTASIGDRDLAIFWKAGQASALEVGSVDGGRDVGSVGVFVPEVDGEALTFAVVEGEITDDQTGSTWTVTGIAVEGPSAGESLERIPHLDTFWFAWSTYRPGTALIEG